jgi:autotransporter-associated beta strand protein
MLTLGGSNTHTGGTVVTAGTLSVAGTHPVPITVNGGTLGGNGTVGDVVATSGAVAPGNSPGILHATDVTLNAGSSLDIQIDGVTPGTGYDQLLVSGTTTINGASLNITSSVTPPDSALFTIATNVSGVFAGMPQRNRGDAGEPAVPAVLRRRRRERPGADRGHAAEPRGCERAQHG